MKIFICFAILAAVATAFAAPISSDISGSQAGANAQTQTFQQGGGPGFYPHGVFIPYGGVSGAQSGASGSGSEESGMGVLVYYHRAPPSFGESATNAGTSTQTFQHGVDGGGASGSQAAANAQTQSFST